MLKRKTIAKILIFALLAVVLLSVLTSCGPNNTVETKKNLSDWKSAEVGKDITLEADRGFVDSILFYIGTFIGWITKIMPLKSYILALFIFAIVVEILMLPFSIKQQKNSIKQARLRPKEMAIRKKYAGRTDQATQQKINQEIQELYQKEQFNPMGGCLPLLIQLPIIMALYSIVVNPLKYVFGYGGNFSGFIVQYMNAPKTEGGLGMNVNTNGTIGLVAQLREKGAEAFEGVKTFFDNPETGEKVYERICEIAERAEDTNFNIGPINMGNIPSFNPGDNRLYSLLAIPVLTFLVYFFSSKISRKFMYQPTQSASGDAQTACSNKMMDWMMPLMSVWMTFIVPAAVGIYWMFKSVVSTVKQIIISKVMPLPVFTEADYKAAEREYAGKQPKKVEKSANAGKVRSLHHIDDEDYDEQGNYIPQPVEDAEYIEVTPEPAKEEKLPENKMTEGASLKDDTDKNVSSKKEKKQKKEKKEKNKKEKND